MVFFRWVDCGAFRGVIIKVVLLCQHSVPREPERDFLPAMFTEDQLHKTKKKELRHSSSKEFIIAKQARSQGKRHKQT